MKKIDSGIVIFRTKTCLNLFATTAFLGKILRKRVAERFF